MKTRLILAALAATASLAACGGGEEPASSGAEPDRQAENRKAMLDFARCMRENGIDMPDPQFNGGRVTMRSGSPDSDPAKLRAADKACAKYRDAIKAPELSDEQKAEFKEAALEHARCMRDQGIDFPDPKFDESGGAQIRLGRNLNSEDPKFRKAQEACRDKSPMGRMNTTAGGE